MLNIYISGRNSSMFKTLIQKLTIDRKKPKTLHDDVVMPNLEDDIRQMRALIDEMHHVAAMIKIRDYDLLHNKQPTTFSQVASHIQRAISNIDEMKKAFDLIEKEVKLDRINMQYGDITVYGNNAIKHYYSIVEDIRTIHETVEMIDCTSTF